MAKDAPLEEARKTAAPARSGGPPAPVPENNPAWQPVAARPDPRDEEVERLRQQVAELRRALERPAAAPSAPPADARPKQRYRVALEGASVVLSTVTVAPRERRNLPEGKRDLPAENYDTLELFAAHPRLSPQKAAWQLYCTQHGLTPAKDWPHFKAKIEARETVPSIVVDAASEADAERAYKLFCGVQKTERSFHTEIVTDEVS